MKFVSVVLQTNKLSGESRVALLECKKRRLAPDVTPGGKLQKALNESASTARAEALRQKHTALVAEFDDAVEYSSRLDALQKTGLHTH